MQKILVDILITEVSTNKQKSIQDTLIIKDGIDAFYQWKNDNLSCDCNRSFFFDKDAICGTGKYKVLIKNAETKEVLYNEQ